MKFKPLIFCLIISASHLIASSDELPAVELKMLSHCSVVDTRNTLFQYNEKRFFSFGFDDKNDFNDSMPIYSDIYMQNLLNKNSKFLNNEDEEPYIYIPSVKLSLMNEDNDIFIFGTYGIESFSANSTDTNVEKLYNIGLGDIVFSRKPPDYFNNSLLKLFSSHNLFFVAEFKKFEGIPKKVKKEVFRLHTQSFDLPKYDYKSGKYIFTKPKKEYRDGIDIENIETNVINRYRVTLDKDAFQKIQEKCEASINSQKRSLISKDISIILASLFGLWIVVMFIYGIYTRAKIKASELKIRAHEYKVQKIAEDEAIRATVKKAIENDIDEAKELQELINKAVAKGDTETAQSLLAILKRRKDKQ